MQHLFSELRSVCLRVLLMTAILAFLMAARPVRADVPLYFLTDLGMLPAPPLPFTLVGGFALGINRYGQVAGYDEWVRQDTAERKWKGFLWDISTLIDTTPFLTGNGSGQINNSAQIAGSYYADAAIWQNGSITDLGHPSSDAAAFGNAINDAGQLVGTASTNWPGFLPEHAFVYGPSGIVLNNSYSMVDLGTLGGSTSEAFGINNNDVIIGNSYLHGDSIFHAMADRLEFYFSGLFGYWAYTMYDLDPGNSDVTGANAINDKNQIVGYEEWAGGGYSASIPVFSQFDTSQNRVTSRSFLPFPYSDSGGFGQAYGINNQGQVVGFYASQSRNVAVLWNNGVAYDLNSLVPSLSGRFSFQILNSASGINDSGQIVGSYSDLLQNQTRAYLLTPYAVSSIMLTPDPIVGGQNGTGTVTLNAPAPAGGAVISLYSAVYAATVPASVTIPAGSTSATFTFKTTPVTTVASGVITAGYNGAYPTALLSVYPNSVIALGLSPNPVHGGYKVSATITLASPAPAGGMSVTLSTDDDTLANFGGADSTTVTIPAGTTSKTFLSVITTRHPAVSSYVTISATANGFTQSTYLLVKH